MIFISKFLPYGKQCIDQEDIDAVADVLSEDFITQGPKITEFEEEIAKYVGAKYGVAFNSGTSALHGAYFALGLDKGDEMITTPNTFVATANAGLYLGAKVNFCDVSGVEAALHDVIQVLCETMGFTAANITRS